MSNGVLLAIHDLASARLRDARVTDDNVRHDLREIVRLAEMVIDPKAPASVPLVATPGDVVKLDHQARRGLEMLDAPPVDREAVTTIHGTPVEKVREEHAAQPTGQHRDYIVLTPEERARGFVRPVRRSYRHVGIAGPRHPIRDIAPHEIGHGHFAKVEVIPPKRDGAPVTVEQKADPVYCAQFEPTLHYWRAEELARIGKGCGTVTTMGQSLAETYARDPSFYGATFCVGCNKHLPVGEGGEFVWEGTQERVGT